MPLPPSQRGGFVNVIVPETRLGAAAGITLHVLIITAGVTAALSVARLAPEGLAPGLMMLSVQLGIAAAVCTSFAHALLLFALLSHANKPEELVTSRARDAPRGGPP